MQISKLNKSTVYKVVAVITAVAILATIASFSAFADNVVIKEEKNTSLTFLRINGNTSAVDWDSSGTYSEPSEGNYQINTNSYTAWYVEDSVDVAYKEYNFNFGKNADFTLTGVLNSWEGTAETASAGIMLRSSTKPDAATVFLHYRPGKILLITRSYDGTMFNGNYDTIIVPQFKPIEFKLVLNKTTVKGYYRYVGNEVWQTVGSKKFENSNTGKLTAGFAAHSADKKKMETANFSDYHVVIEAPEGTAYDDAGNSSDTPQPEEEVKLPEDLTPAENVLMRETFTDGNMFNGEPSVSNPIWNSDVLEPDIITNADATNRYLKLFYDKGYYFAGDLNWTDYTFETDLKFTDETTIADYNELTLMTRFTDIEQYGYSYYGVHFYTNINTGKRYVEIGHTRASLLTQAMKEIDASVEFDYLADFNTHKVKITAFDNIITVYWDGKEIISYTDEGQYDVKLKGCIGFYTNNCSVELDNITVAKLQDALGGDYDNQIGGLFNEPMPEYLDRYSKNNWCY